MRQNILIPGSIILAGAIIALGVFLQGGGTFSQITAGTYGDTPVAQAAGREDYPYTRGNEDAEITIVEFSDFECPFCARLHPTLERIVEESDGKVVWEYRHFPLPSHRNAEEAALSGECIGRLGGNDKFWEFADSAFQSQRSFSTEFFESEAARLGVDIDKFRSCVNDKETQDILRADYTAAIASGGRGTPHGVIVFQDGTQRSFSGALPYEQLVGLLNL